MTTGAMNRPRIEPRPEFAKILRVEKSFAAAGGGGAATGINDRFDRLIVQSGTQASPAVILRLCILGGVTLGGTAFVASENLLATAAAFAVGAFLPIAVLLAARAHRQRAMRRQLPALLENLAQAARGGLGLAGGLERAAVDTPAPLSDEIRLGLGRFRMGVGIEAAFEDLPERTGLPAMQVLATALADHDRTGSDLIALLDRTATRLAGAM